MKTQPLSSSSPRVLLSVLAASLAASLAAGCSHQLSWSAFAGKGSSSSRSPEQEPAPTSPPPQATEVQHSAEDRTFVEASEVDASNAAGEPESRLAYDAPVDEPTDEPIDEPTTRRPSRGSDRAGSSAPPPPSEPTSVSAQLRSSCSQPVKLLLAGRSTDTTISLDANEVESRSLDVGGKAWLLDASGSKLVALDIYAALRTVTVGADCASISGS
jgi:hypothetical protein